MKKLYCFIFAISQCWLAAGQSIENPVAHFSKSRNLTSSDLLKKIDFDFNGDGLLDMALTYEDPNPDIVERKARVIERHLQQWDIYVKDQVFGYVLSKGIAKSGKLAPDALLSFRPDEVHLGAISEISRFALVTFYKYEIKGAPPKTTIVAYTWEMDHFKSHELANYEEEDSSPLFDKYLNANVRTSLSVQLITP